MAYWVTAVADDDVRGSVDFHIISYRSLLRCSELMDIKVFTPESCLIARVEERHEKSMQSLL